MPKGFTLLELVIVTCIAGILLAFWVPRASQLMDWFATERAARDVTTAIAVGRHGAVMRATRARIRFNPDSIRIERLESQSWVPWWQTPGPASYGVRMEISNPTITVGPNGMAWGVSNTRIVLRRGSQSETITMSRVGRVKRW
jgi:prepilin-type N-terminal cleavage/methylation domain-containing protein